MTQYIINYAKHLSSLEKYHYIDTNDYPLIDKTLSSLLNTIEEKKEEAEKLKVYKKQITNFMQAIRKQELPDNILKSDNKLSQIILNLKQSNLLDKKSEQENVQVPSGLTFLSFEDPIEFDYKDNVKSLINSNETIKLSHIQSFIQQNEGKTFSFEGFPSSPLINLEDIDKMNESESTTEENFKKNEKLHLPWISVEAIKELQDSLKENTKAERNELVYNYLSKLQRFKPIVEIEDYSIFNKVLEKAPNFSEVLNHFKGNFILNQARRKSEDIYFAPKPILLLGDPGIGKTYFAKMLAQELQTSYHFIDSNSITGGWILSGSGGIWKNSDAGLIFKNMLSSNTVSPLMIFDEIDKLSDGKNHDPFSTFHQLLEPENAREFKDEFLNISFDASNIIYILTANNANNIPESLLSRMKVFHVPNPTPEETRIIAQRMYEDIIGETEFFTKKLNEDMLIQLEKFSPRKIKQVLEDAVYSQVAQLVSLNDQVNLEFKEPKAKKSMGFSHS